MDGNKIYLKAVEPQDIDFILALENNANNWRLSETLFPYSRYDIENFVLNTEHDITVNKQIRLMIIEKTDLKPVGCIDLFDYNPVHRRAGIGIIVSEENRKNGSTKALSQGF